MKRAFCGLLMAGLLVATIAGCTPQQAAAPGQAGGPPIKIGASLDLTGNQSEGGRTYRDMFQWVVEETNKAGGIKGRQIATIVVDDRTDAALATSIARRFVTEEKVVAIYGGTASTTGIPTAKVAAEAGIPFMGGAAAGDLFVDPLHKWFFSWTGGTKHQGAGYAKALTNDGRKKIAQIYTNLAWSRDQMQWTEKLGKEKGLQFFDAVPVSNGATDVSVEVTKLRASNPDAVVAHLYPVEMAAFRRALASLNWNPPTYQLKAMIDVAAGSVGMEMFEGSKALLNADPSYPPLQEMFQKFEKATGKRPVNEVFAAMGYDGITVLIQALKVARNPDDPASIRDALEKDVVGMPLIRGVQRVIEWTPSDHSMQMDHPVVPIRGGKFMY